MNYHDLFIESKLQFNLTEFNIDEYLNIETETNSEETNIYDNTIKETFKNKVIYNIKSYLNSKGYESENIKVEIDDECNILKIIISEIYENKENENSNVLEESKIIINSIETNINEIDIKEKRAKGMAISDKNSLIDYLVDNYQIDKKNIIIE